MNNTDLIVKIVFLLGAVGSKDGNHDYCAKVNLCYNGKDISEVYLNNLFEFYVTYSTEEEDLSVPLETLSTEELLVIFGYLKSTYDTF